MVDPGQVKGSTQAKVMKLSGLSNNDLTEWERGFMVTLKNKLAMKTLHTLSPNQIAAMERLYDKHFGG